MSASEVVQKLFAIFCITTFLISLQQLTTYQPYLHFCTAINARIYEQQMSELLFLCNMKRVHRTLALQIIYANPGLQNSEPPCMVIR